MLNRREFVAATSLLLASNPWRAFADEPYVDFGLIDAPEEDIGQPLASSFAQKIAGSGEGKVVLLWKALEHATKHSYIPHNQKGNDCVGHAAALAVDVLSSIQAVYKQARWRGKHSTEVIYAGSRIDIGIEKHGWTFGRDWKKKQLKRGGGSTPVWATEWLQDYGALRRARYDQYDLRWYNYGITKSWADTGVPEELEQVSRAHPVLTTVKIDDGWDQACDFIANGYPIMVGSRIGFNNVYDRDGFMRHDRIWPHALLLWGIDTKSDRPGGNFANSAGYNWTRNRRQHRYGTPAGSLWVDATVCDKMLNFGRSYAISNFRGYPRRTIDYLVG